MPATKIFHARLLTLARAADKTLAADVQLPPSKGSGAWIDYSTVVEPKNQKVGTDSGAPVVVPKIIIHNEGLAGRFACLGQRQAVVKSETAAGPAVVVIPWRDWLLSRLGRDMGVEGV